MTDRTDGASDPGADAAGARAADVENAAATPIDVGSGGHIRIGTASWTDPTMTATGVFYPTSATTAEERLQHYASTFPLVEVDATYYALPSAATAKLWVERTPPDFVFDIKAHALMTGQGTETKRLPKAHPRRAARARRDARPGSTPRTCPPSSSTRSGRRSGTASSRSPRPASWARSCSSTRAGSSRRRRTARRSRRPPCAWPG